MGFNGAVQRLSRGGNRGEPEYAALGDAEQVAGQGGQTGAGGDDAVVPGVTRLGHDGVLVSVFVRVSQATGWG
jgi:hypothetical protein